MASSGDAERVNMSNAGAKSQVSTHELHCCILYTSKLMSPIARRTSEGAVWCESSRGTANEAPRFRAGRPSRIGV